MEPHYVSCAGGIVLGDSGTVAVVRNRKDSLWFFPKGKVEEGETDEDAALREIAEETGLHDIELIDDLGVYERPRILPDGTYDETEMKQIHMYLFAAQPHASVSPSLEIEETQWMSFSHLAQELADMKDRAWFSSVFERVRHAIQRD